MGKPIQSSASCLRFLPCLRGRARWGQPTDFRLWFIFCFPHSWRQEMPAWIWLHLLGVLRAWLGKYWFTFTLGPYGSSFRNAVKLQYLSGFPAKVHPACAIVSYRGNMEPPTQGWPQSFCSWSCAPCWHPWFRKQVQLLLGRPFAWHGCRVLWEPHSVSLH